MTKIVWVTGAAGFTGHFMLKYLRSLDAAVRIVGIDLVPPTQSDANAFLQVDLCDRDSVAAAVNVEPPNVVIHLAGLMPPHSEQDMQRINVGATTVLADVLGSSNSANVHLICAGSAAEYDRQIERPDEESPCVFESPYGRSKIEQSRRVLSYNSPQLKVIVARPFNLLGPGLSENLVAGSLCRQFMRSGRSEGTISPRGSVASVRDFVDVRDVVKAYWLLARHGAAGEIYNICTGEGTSISQLIALLQDAFDMHVEVKPDYDETRILTDVSIGDNRKLKSLGWKPDYSIKDSISEMVKSALYD